MARRYQTRDWKPDYGLGLKREVGWDLTKGGGTGSTKGDDKDSTTGVLGGWRAQCEGSRAGAYHDDLMVAVARCEEQGHPWPPSPRPQ